MISFGCSCTLTSALSVLSSAASVVTVIDSVRSPISSEALTRRMLPAVNGIPVCVNVLNPCSEAASVYEPGRTLRIVYAPSPSVVVSSLSPVPSLVTVTVTPGMDAPVLSVTVPVTLPYRACAFALPARASQAQASNRG